MKVLVLGHKGMLGSTLSRYLKENGMEVDTISDCRWPDLNYTKTILKSKADAVVNCLGCIPQKKPKEQEYLINNFFLPVFLANNFKGRVIHPTTDCEFIGSNNAEHRYTKDCKKDATDPYGKSKILASDYLLESDNTTIIRTSIIGRELNTQYSLWDWFAKNKEQSVDGYVNHLWNGITTLQWSKICKELLESSMHTRFLQVGTEDYISKGTLLETLNKAMKLKKFVNMKFQGSSYVNKCLKSDMQVPNIQEQIDEVLDWK